jgi:hypothetical protein
MSLDLVQHSIYRHLAPDAQRRAGMCESRLSAGQILLHTVVYKHKFGEPTICTRALCRKADITATPPSGRRLHAAAEGACSAGAAVNVNRMWIKAQWAANDPSAPCHRVRLCLTLPSESMRKCPCCCLRHSLYQLAVLISLPLPLLLQSVSVSVSLTRSLSTSFGSYQADTCTTRVSERRC